MYSLLLIQANPIWLWLSSVPGWSGGSALAGGPCPGGTGRQ